MNFAIKKGRVGVMQCVVAQGCGGGGRGITIAAAMKTTVVTADIDAVHAATTFALTFVRRQREWTDQAGETIGIDTAGNGEF